MFAGEADGSSSSALASIPLYSSWVSAEMLAFTLASGTAATEMIREARALAQMRCAGGLFGFYCRLPEKDWQLFSLSGSVACFNKARSVLYPCDEHCHLLIVGDSDGSKHLTRLHSVHSSVHVKQASNLKAPLCVVVVFRKALPILCFGYHPFSIFSTAHMHLFCR